MLTIPLNSINYFDKSISSCKIVIIDDTATREKASMYTCNDMGDY